MQRHFRSLILIVFILLAVTACSPSESAIATAIAQTQAAQPTEPGVTVVVPTNTLQPTHIPTPTSTPEPSLTPTPTETLTPTPDLRVIDADPKLFLMTVEDLPKEGKYFLPNSGWISPHRNSEVVSGWGVEEGRKYLEETGRVDGWWVYYARGTNTVNLPDEISDNVILYKTIQGAELLIAKHSDCINPDGSPAENYILIDDLPTIGDRSVACFEKEMQPNGKNKVQYLLEFQYRNFFHNVYMWGWEYEVSPENLIAVANNLLKKLQSAPLSDSVTFTP